MYDYCTPTILNNLPKLYYNNFGGKQTKEPRLGVAHWSLQEALGWHTGHSKRALGWHTGHSKKLGGGSMITPTTQLWAFENAKQKQNSDKTTI